MSDESIKRELKNEKLKILSDRKRVEVKKVSFINEIKDGLGDEIKNNSGIIIKEKTFKTKSMGFFNKLIKLL